MKNEELEDMIKEAPGPINFTVFLTMFGEKLKGEMRTEAGREIARQEWEGRLVAVTHSKDCRDPGARLPLHIWKSLHYSGPRQAIYRMGTKPLTYLPRCNNPRPPS